MSQELSGWEAQVRNAADRVRAALDGVCQLAIGGTAVGTGINTHPDFGKRVAARLAAKTGLPFSPNPNYFAALSGQDAVLALSAQLRGAAVVLFKIANDLRWMNSGPAAGLSEIALQPLQAGSSIMPGKVNPVLPEAAAMLCAQVQGNDLAVMLGAQSGNFQLNVMLPLIAWNLLNSNNLVTGACGAIAKAIASFEVNGDHLLEAAHRNPILATALAPRIGYDKSAAIAKEALRSGRSVMDVAREQSGLSDEELTELLDPPRMV
jgi:fumarate hydratase class II